MPLISVHDFQEALLPIMFTSFQFHVEFASAKKVIFWNACSLKFQKCSDRQFHHDFKQNKTNIGLSFSLHEKKLSYSSNFFH